MLKKMSQFCGVNVTITDHPTHNFTKCKVTCLNASKYTDEGLLAELEEQGVTAVKQFKKKINGDLVPTGTFIITVKGNMAPTHIYFGFNRAVTRTYYPNPLLCFNCYEFGHTKTKCPNQSCCGNCSANHISTPDKPCTKTSYCKRCESNSHAISSRKCPDYLREDDIQHIRIDDNLSYSDAKKVYEQEHNEQTMATVIRTGYEEQLRELTKKLDTLLVDIGRKDAQITELTKQNIKLQTLLKENLERQKNTQDMQAQTPTKSEPSPMTKQSDTQTKKQHLPGTISKKQAQQLRKVLREQEEAESNEKNEKENNFTAAHKKIQRTYSNIESVVIPTSIDNTEISNGSTEPMDDDSISSGEEDPLAKQL